MIGDAREDVGEPGLRIDIVELRGLDQRVDDGRALPAAIGPAEQPCLATERNAAERALCGVVKGHSARDAQVSPACRYGNRDHRDRGAGSKKWRQAVLTMSCEFELLLGRPYDLPSCAASANP